MSSESFENEVEIWKSFSTSLVILHFDSKICSFPVSVDVSFGSGMLCAEHLSLFLTTRLTDALVS